MITITNSIAAQTKPCSRFFILSLYTLLLKKARAVHRSRAYYQHKVGYTFN